MQYFLNPVAAPETDYVSAGLMFVGVVFLIASIVSVIFFALKQANSRYEKSTEKTDNNEDEK